LLFLCDLQPEGNYILAFQNEDRPGAISEVLQVLHGASVNVASLNVTRPHDKSGLALTFMALDDDIPTNALSAIKKLSKVKSVHKVNLK
jgi:ACT domain-containing protein